MAAGRRRDRLVTWLVDELPMRFEDRLLTVDRAVSETWGAMMARTQRTSRGLGSLDALFAATADVHGLS
jgi:predicted nucleic acid-binding protein